MKNTLILLTLTLLLFACKKDDEAPSGNFLSGDGVFVINEGNFLSGNGSLSFYSPDSSKIYNDLFTSINGRPLGDVPNSMELFGDKACIVVNNSGKVEIVDNSTLESKGTITGMISPRNIAFVNSSKAYVTSMYSDSVIILNLVAGTIDGYINIRRTSEAVVVLDEKAYVASWVGGNEVMVINTATDQLIDSIEVGIEPESMAADRNGTLWVLCNGGWMRENYAELDAVNTATDVVVKRMIFPTKQESPVCLKIDASGEVLYFLDGGVRKMSISASELPAEPLIPESGRYFYRLAICPGNGDIYVTDASDYQQNGYLIRYNSGGELVATMQAEIIPGSMCFRYMPND